MACSSTAEPLPPPHPPPTPVPFPWQERPSLPPLWSTAALLTNTAFPADGGLLFFPPCCIPAQEASTNSPPAPPSSSLTLIGEVSPTVTHHRSQHRTMLSERWHLRAGLTGGPRGCGGVT